MKRLRVTAIALGLGIFNLVGCTERPTEPPVTKRPSLQADVSTNSASGYLQVSAAFLHTCTLRTDGTLACWGTNGYGEGLPPAGNDFRQMDAGGWNACATRADGSLACWGLNDYGQASPPAGTDYVQVSAGGSHFCALKTDGSLACWGEDKYGETTPPQGTDFVQVDAGSYYACALKTDGSLACWGRDDFGQASPPTGTDFVQISAAGGGSHSCALKTDGSLACWGINPNGVLTPPAGNNFAQVTTSYNYSCALRTDGSLVCWGLDIYGYVTPPAGTDFLQVSAGNYHACALKTDHSVACWGTNQDSELRPLFAVAPTAPTKGEVVTFNNDDVESTDCHYIPPESRTYAWNFGDGMTGTGMNPSHTYADAGLYQVSLTLSCAGLPLGTTMSVPVSSDNALEASFTVTPSAAEGAAVTFDASGSSGPDGVALTYTWDYGDGTTGNGVTSSHSYGDEGSGSYTITLTVSDPSGATATATDEATVTNAAPVLGALSGPTSPLAIGTSASISGSLTDPGVLDTHGASVDWGDGATSAATITEANGSGSLTNSHTYTSPGVYEVSVTLTDDDGGMATALFRYIAVYDPVGGSATGAGWINSPAGACRLVECTDATVGKAMFGFVSRYQKGATSPSGTTEFQFKDGGLRFTSESYQWFVVSGPQAQLKGTGTVNGVAGYGFLLTARDGDQPGGGGEDRFRIKIWDGNGTVVYDNQMGAADNGDAATSLGGGQIQIHP